MSSNIKLLICIAFISYLFWRDGKNPIEGVSSYIIIPLLWVLPSTTRDYSVWLYYWFGIGSAYTVIEGSSIDRAIQLSLIAVALILLNKRKLNWPLIIKSNPLIFLFFTYALLSILWSDFPYVSFKRLVKSFGNVIMVMVILTESRPYEAFGLMIKRLAILLLPLSIIFIKYFPAVGRQYHHSSGAVMYLGVASQKNGLGQICLITFIYFYWKFLFDRFDKNEIYEHIDPLIKATLLPLLFWLLYKSHSATSVACVIIAFMILSVGRIKFIYNSPSNLIYLTVFCIFSLITLQYSFNVTDEIIILLGRSPDLTTRVPMWKDLLNMVKNPLIGFGYESFWLGERRLYMKDTWAITSQAHNGYLEIYLNLGLIGLTFVIMWIISGIFKVFRNITFDYKTNILRFCLIIVFAFSNWTEATFVGTSEFFVYFFLSIFEIPRNSYNS